jgi:hypothetical protein
MEVKIDRNTARQLYEALLRPEKDKEGNAVYIVSLSLARELREGLFDALGVGK